MPDPTLVQSSSNVSATASTVVTFGSTAVAGNLLVLCVAGDDYKTGDPSGWTLLSPGGEQQTFLGHNFWWKKAAGGETSVTYVIGSASKSTWHFMEFNNIDATTQLDAAAGTFLQSFGTTMATSSIVPTTGRRLCIATIGGSGGSVTGLSGWTNSYTEVLDSRTASPLVSEGTAWQVLTGDGATGTSTTATYDTGGPGARTAIIGAFRASTGGGAVSGDASLTGTAVITAGAAVTRPAAGGLVATATITAGAAVTRPADASLVATAIITASATRTAVAQVSLTGTATITATAAVTPLAAASLTATATVSASAFVVRPAAATLTGTAVITAGAQLTEFAQAGLTITAVITATFLGGPILATASLTITATISASALRMVPSDASLTGTATITASALRTAVSGATLTGTATISASALRTAVAAATLVGLATITVGAGRQTFAGATLSALAVITAVMTSSADVPAVTTAFVTAGNGSGPWVSSAGRSPEPYAVAGSGSGLFVTGVQ